MVNFENRIRVLRRAADRLEELLNGTEFMSGHKRQQVTEEIRELLAVADIYEEIINK